MITPRSGAVFRRSLQMCRQSRERTRTPQRGVNFCISMHRRERTRKKWNGDNLQIIIQRIRRIMVVVFLSPLHSPWSGEDFRT